MPPTDMLAIPALQKAYRLGQKQPTQVLRDIFLHAQTLEDYNIWIHLLSEEELAPYLDALSQKDPLSHPLWGIPFAIKDNIDLAGIPTTAACEAFAYTPRDSAKVVQKLLDAGAIPVGKTNMDQFATGLNGTRSPWGACKNAFNPKYISGGSSSGSAVAVALGLASFSLGTDTAGSGRVPACFNQLVGLKPTRGLLSSSGMVPACKSLDCMTFFTRDPDDANTLLSVAEGVDNSDPFSRANVFQNSARQYGEREGPMKVGRIPEQQLNFFADSAYANAYSLTLQTLEKLDIEWVDIDYEPFAEAAKLLYEGPWVAERYLATQALIEDQPEAIFPVVRDIIAKGREHKATALFLAEYRLAAFKKQCLQQLEHLDCLLTPTAGRCFTLAELLEEPVLRNSQLGYYTNFMNLLDLASVALPTKIAENGLPFGITIVGPAFSDRALLSIAKKFHGVFELPPGASQFASKHSHANSSTSVSSTKSIEVLVCGAHLSGLPLNWQLLERGAKLKTAIKTAPVYRMFALSGGPPARPGLLLDEQHGAAIEAEIWSVPADQFGSFVQGISAPLGIGKVRLADGSSVCGFICEPYGLEGAKEITSLGDWRVYIDSI